MRSKKSVEKLQKNLSFGSSMIKMYTRCLSRYGTLSEEEEEEEAVKFDSVVIKLDGHMADLAPSMGSLRN